jgi:hypothetical protein
MYNWTLPLVDTLKSTGAKTYSTDQFTRCVMRIRYNISTDDYEPWNTNRKFNDATGTLITHNTYVDNDAINYCIKCNE